jgi:hypothetical protein
LSAKLICVDPKRVHEFWPYAKNLILSAILRTGLSQPTDIERDILNGHQLLWLAWDGAIKAAASTHLANNVCTVTACGGSNLNEWLPLFAQIEQYAKNEGCRCVRIYGRKGWLRVLKGYEARHVIIERRL